jgi:hypothetical protein
METNNIDDLNIDNLEETLQDKLNKSRAMLGDAVPRLITQKPQVATNGLTHGLTGQFSYLTDIQLVIYLSTGAQYFKEMQPVGIRETQMLQRIVDTGWRLTRIPHITQALEHSGVTYNAGVLRVEHPEYTDTARQPHAEAVAFRADVDNFEKISRYETRLSRLFDNLNKEFERIQDKRTRPPEHDEFDLETCEAYQWYTELSRVAGSLIEARAELAEKSDLITSADISLSNITSVSLDDLVCKKYINILVPLTPRTVQILKTSRQWGLLTAMELELFEDPIAA